MLRSSAELEKDLVQLKDRLAGVYQVVEGEQRAWAQCARLGPSGTKWRGAVPSPRDPNDGMVDQGKKEVCNRIEKSSSRPLASSFKGGNEIVLPLISSQVKGEARILEESQAKPIVRSTRKQCTSLKKTPVATCWHCKRRCSRPYTNQPIARVEDSLAINPRVSSTLQTSSVPRVFCSQTCQERVEASAICIVPTLNTFVKDSLASSGTHCQSPRGVTKDGGCTTYTQRELGRKMKSIQGHRRGWQLVEAKESQRLKRGPRRSNVPVDELGSFDFLHIAPPVQVPESSLPPRRDCTKKQVKWIPCTQSRTMEQSGVHIAKKYPSVTSVPINAHQALKMVPMLALDTFMMRGVPTSNQVYQRSQYKLDTDVERAQQETFSTCFGALSSPHRSQSEGSKYSQKNFLRLQDFITVRTLHRLSLSSRTWYNLITKPSAFNDAVWNVHILRLWTLTPDDLTFLHNIGVLRKPERPRRRLQVLTRHVSRVLIENVKVLVHLESWHFATVMSSQGMQSLHQSIKSKQSQGYKNSDESEQTDDLYEQITAIFMRTGEIVAICASQLVRPLDPQALVSDILQGLKNGEPCRVHCRRLRLFSQTNRLPIDQWTRLAHSSRVVVDFCWSDTNMGTAGVPLCLWHQKVLSKLQRKLQQRLLSTESVHGVFKYAHDQNASAAVLLSLETFIRRCRTHVGRTLK